MSRSRSCKNDGALKLLSKLPKHQSGGPSQRVGSLKESSGMEVPDSKPAMRGRRVRQSVVTMLSRLQSA